MAPERPRNSLWAVGRVFSLMTHSGSSMMKNQVAALSLERLAHYACRPWRGSRHYEDLLQEARIGIWQALDTYDPNKGAFSTHATTRAHGAVQHYLLSMLPTGVDRELGVVL